jgi:DNA-binding CsgD family transcriptional regulator
LWHLYSGGDFLKNRWLHPNPDDDVHLIPIPVVQWSNVAPILLDFSEIQDPVEALSHQQALRIKHRLEDIRSFVLGSLSPAEERVVALLVKTGLSDNELAEELFLSPRTVEQHLRSAYRKASDHWGLSVVGRAQLITLLNLYYSTQITGNPA